MGWMGRKNGAGDAATEWVSEPRLSRVPPARVSVARALLRVLLQGGMVSRLLLLRPRYRPSGSSEPAPSLA